MSEPLRAVLGATGFLVDGQAGPGVRLGDEARRARRSRCFEPDALWRAQSNLTVYFKSASAAPPADLVGQWRREIWNEGFAPLLWVVSPERIDLYNGFGAPAEKDDAARNRLRDYANIDAALRELDAYAGRLAMETGAFWLNAPEVSRKTSVDQWLLDDLAHLERDLVGSALERGAAQALIGRSIFTQYLVDRRIVTPERLKTLCGCAGLAAILRDAQATRTLFSWLSDTFNGDMFPPETAGVDVALSHLTRIADFLDAVDPTSGQKSLFPYQFDIVPVELISSIYERFVHADSPAAALAGSTQASIQGVYYTRLPLVSLVLDEIMDGLTGQETIADLTCGSGVFLVEALRRLVDLKAGANLPTRSLVRETLYHQIFGVDISEAAIRIAAFSLYLAALELDPDPEPPEALTFAPLIDRSLFIGDAHDVDRTARGAALIRPDGERRRFDIIVGNPPWSFKGRAGTAARRRSSARAPAQPRGEGLDFVLRALEFAHERTRFGVVLSALPFFSASKTGAAAARYVVQKLAPVTLVNLSELSEWLFPTVTMPAVVLLARHREQDPNTLTVVQVPWSEGGARSHTFEIAPSNVNRLRLEDWERAPFLLKATAFGHRRDTALLCSLSDRFCSLSTQLEVIGTELGDGLTLGNQTSDARELQGLEILSVKNMRPFRVPDVLGRFDLGAAERPRTRERYRAPLLLVKEFLAKSPRAVTIAADRDLLYMHGIYGAPMKTGDKPIPELLCGILSSAFAAWFFTMTAAEFALWKRRLLIQDIARLPTPNLRAAVISESGLKIVALARNFAKDGISDLGLQALDEAVFDLYELDGAERLVAGDGLLRGGWEWQAGRLNSVAPAGPDDLRCYAQTFNSVIDAWLAARGRRRLRAEIIVSPGRETLRTVRFVLEDAPGPSYVVEVEPTSDLNTLLASISARLQVRLTDHLVGGRELRVHGSNEIVVIKPAARRHWMAVAALEDADAVVVESFTAASA